MYDWQLDLTPPRGPEDREEPEVRESEFSAFIKAGTVLAVGTDGKVRPAQFGDEIIGVALGPPDHLGNVRVQRRM